MFEVEALINEGDDGDTFQITYTCSRKELVQISNVMGNHLGLDGVYNAWQKIRVALLKGKGKM